MKIPHALPSLTALTLFACLTLNAHAVVKFYAVPITSTKTLPITVTFPAAATLGSISVRTQGAENLEFTNVTGGTCTIGVQYAAHATCTVMAAFTPRYPGVRYGAVVLLDPTTSQNVIATAYLQGTGSGPQIAFTGQQPQLRCPAGDPGAIALDGAGNIYFADGSGILSITADGTCGPELFFGVSSIAIDGAGNAYVASNDTVYKQTPAPGNAYVQSTVATGFSRLNSVAVDGSGNLYLAEQGAYPNIPSAIIKLTLAPNGTYLKSIIGTGHPFQLAVDSAANVYATDRGGRTAFKETVSGSTYTQSTIGSFYYPTGIAVAPNLDVYVTQDYDFPFDDGYGETWILNPLPNGSYNQTLFNYNPRSPEAIATDAQGNLWYSDLWTEEIVSQAFSTPPTQTFPDTFYQPGSTEAHNSVSMQNSGNEPLQIASITFPKSFPVTSDCTVLAPGATCNLNIGFSPASPLNGTTRIPITGNVIILSNNLNQTKGQLSIPVSGNQIPPTVAMPVISPASTLNYVHAPFMVSITDATPGATISYYTNDTATPVSRLYTGPFLVSGTENIFATATAPNYLPSYPGQADYYFAPYAPKATPQSGIYTAPVLVTLTSQTTAAKIYYTLDGSQPTAASTLYTTPISVAASETLTAVSISSLPGYQPSLNLTASYVIQ